MQIDKHSAALKEVMEAVEEALVDKRGLLHRQRLLMAALSLGVQHWVELWLHRNGAIESGASVKHEWFQAEERKLKLRLAGILTKKLDTLDGHAKILAIAREVERDRNAIIYGAPLSSDVILREKIDAFLELRKAVEEAVGGDK